MNTCNLRFSVSHIVWKNGAGHNSTHELWVNPLTSDSLVAVEPWATYLLRSEPNGLYIHPYNRMIQFTAQMLFAFFIACNSTRRLLVVWLTDGRRWRNGLADWRSWGSVVCRKPRYHKACAWGPVAPLTSLILYHLNMASVAISSSYAKQDNCRRNTHGKERERLEGAITMSYGNAVISKWIRSCFVRTRTDYIWASYRGWKRCGV